MKVLVDGLTLGESPRWHEGRLWFAHWGTGEIVAVDLDGRPEVVARGAEGLGWSIDWLPDGRLLVTGESLRVQDADGSLAAYGDFSGVDHSGGWNEVVVDGRGHVYLNGMDFDFLGGGAPQPGVIAMVGADGVARQVADGIEFPNGMIVTPDNSTLIIAESFARRLTAFDIASDGTLSNRRTWAENIGPDGICLDAEGAIWAQAVDVDAEGRFSGAVVRIAEGGAVLQRIDLDRFCFACMLGGADGRTLFALAADWRGVEQIDAVLADRTGQVLVFEAPAPRSGWP